MTTMQRAVNAAHQLGAVITDHGSKPYEVSAELRSLYREFRYWQMRAGGEATQVAAFIADADAKKLADGTFTGWENLLFAINYYTGNGKK